MILPQTNPAQAQGAAPNGDLNRACDLAAASPLDKQRPADVPAVAYKALKPDAVIAACEAASRAAPQDSRMTYQLARGYRRAGKLPEAIPLFQRLAQSGYALAAYDLAAMYKKGEGVPVDLKAQVYYLEQAARAGLGNAAYELGKLYGTGNAVVSKDEKIARQWLYFATNDNFAPAMNDLGVMLQNGMGGNQDDVEARSWFEKAAQAGNAAAMNNLGFCFQTGRGGAKDLIEARTWFQKSANGNNPDGTNSLGVMFEKGLGGPQDLEEAHRLYRKAIALGETRHAEKNLERLDRTAAALREPPPAAPAAKEPATKDTPPTEAPPAVVGAPNDDAEARASFERGARAGNYAAMNDLGVCYQTGRGGALDMVEARTWFQRAANGKNPDATNNLGWMFEHGLGGPQDLEEAHRLYRRAIVLGEKQYAEKNLERLDRATAEPSEPPVKEAETPPSETPPPEAPTKEAAPSTPPPSPAPPSHVARTETPAPGSGNPIKTCDLAAASLFDKQRPADVPGIRFDAIKADVAVPACEAAVRAAPNDPRMSYLLARAYLRTKKYTEAIPIYGYLAQNGNALAAYDLSVMYLRGLGVPTDLKANVYYLDKSARAGLNIAQRDLGWLYINGNAVVPKNDEAARHFFSLAAQDNYAPAMYAFGIMLERGIGGKQDDVEARSWYEKAANAGIYSAMTNLAYFIEKGRGGPKDFVEARRWYEKAVSGNDAMGANNLGLMVQQGLGGPRDLDEARRLFKKAIELGEKVYAAKNLAKLEQAGAAPQPGPGRTPSPAPAPGSSGTVCERFPNLC